MSKPVEPPSLEEKFGRKWTPLVIVVLIFGLGLIWILGYRLSGNSAVADLENKIKQSGQPLTVADLAANYAATPDATNGAALLLDVWEQTAPEFWRAFRDGSGHLPQRPDPKYDRALPFLGPDAQHLSRTNALPATNLVAAEVYVEGMADHLDAVRAALRCSQFRFPIQITNGFNALLPHLAPMKAEAMNFRIEALLAGERGDVDAALGSLEDAARVGKALANEPFIISQLVRIACNNMVLEDLQRLLSRRALSTRQLERVDALLDQLQMPGALRAALISERACDLSAFSLPAAQVLGTPGEDRVAVSGSTAAMGVLSILGLKAADHRLMLETMTEAIALAGKDDPHANEQIEALFRDVGSKARQFPPKLFTSMLLPSLERVPTRFAACEGRRRAAKSAVAVERYRLAHDGHLPENLEALVPDFLKEVPPDPFDGNPLRFRPLSPGFVVYSIGANRVDDGGKERLKYSSHDYDETFFIER